MKKSTCARLVLIASSLFSVSVFAGTGESIVLNPATGNYLVTYHDPADGKFHQVTFVPSTKIQPTLKSEFELTKGGVIRYRYTLISGRDSQQMIWGFGFDPVSSVTTPQPDIPDMATLPVDRAGQLDVEKVGAAAMDMMATEKYFDTPPLWEAIMTYSDSRSTFRIGWMTKRNSWLHPGEKVVVGFKSRDLPGIIRAEINGYAPDRQGISGEEMPDEPGDDPFWQQYFALIWNDFVRRPAAVPTLTVAKPFDGVAVLKQLRDNVAKWPGMNVVEPATANAVNSSLQTAMDQLGAGQTDAAIRTLKSIRSHLDQMLSNDSQTELAEANRKLVQEVLQFDLGYICRALGSHEKDD